MDYSFTGYVRRICQDCLNLNNFIEHLWKMKIAGSVYEFYVLVPVFFVIGQLLSNFNGSPFSWLNTFAENETPNTMHITEDEKH